MVMNMPMARIFSSNAIPNGKGTGTRGGVAIVIPTNRGMRFGRCKVIIPGLVIQAEFCFWTEGGCWITSAYFPPDLEKELTRLLGCGNQLAAGDDKPHWLVGDVNISRHDLQLNDALIALTTACGAEEVTYVAASPSVRGTQEGENGRGAASADPTQSARSGSAVGQKSPAGPGHRLIDRVFTTDTLIALGAADCRVSQCAFPAKTLGAGHHLLAIRRSTRSPCHTSAADAYKAVPWGACTRSRVGAA